MDTFKIILITAMSYMFIGCSDTPQNSLEDMYYGLKEGNVPKVYRVTSEAKARALTVEALKDCSVDKTAYKDDNFKLGEDCFVEMFGDIEIKNIEVTKTSETKASAVVTYVSDSKSIKRKEQLRKINGKWLVMHFQ